MDGDQLLDQPYVPVDLAALSEAGIWGEIAAQMDRGQAVLVPAGFRRPAACGSTRRASFAAGDSSDIAAGLQQAGAPCSS